MINRFAIDLNSTVVQTENLASSELDGETILMGPDWRAYFGMDSTAQRIWKLVAQPCRVADLCAQLTAEYAVDEKTCEQNVCAFLNQLREEGLLRVLAEPGGYDPLR